MSSQLDKNVAIGIDLGTTFSRIAVYQNGRIKLISNPEGYKRTPCEVAFRDLTVLAGNPAMNQGGVNAKNTIFDVKRLIGRSFGDSEVQSNIKNYPFQVKQGEDGMVIEVESPNGEKNSYPPIKILEEILEKMKDTTKRHFKHEVNRAVITVPANFNDRQRQEVEDAAKAVGFEVLELIDEPTAAALAFGFDNVLAKDKKVMFFDLGGGTFDVSIIEITRDCTFEVLATAGDTHFGGSDFDQVLLEHFAREIKEKYDKDITNDPRALRRLRTACVSTKENLSGTIDTHIEVDALIGKDDFNSQITRKKFEELSANLFEKIPKAIEKALANASLKASDIDDVVLIGGSTRIPKVQEILNEYFRGKLNHSINPDEAVAYGAAVQAAVLFGSKFENSSKKFKIRKTVSSASTISKNVSMNAPKTSSIGGTFPNDYTNAAEKTRNISMNDNDSSFKANSEAVRDPGNRHITKNDFKKLKEVSKGAVESSQTPKESTNSTSSSSYFSSQSDGNVAIGIDLGTTFSRVAVYQNGRIELILSPEKYKKTPCEVAFRDSKIFAGNSAMNQGGVNAKNIIFDVKRLIGRSLEDPEVQRDIKNYPFQVKQGEDGMVIEVESPNGKITLYPPIVILKMILGKMRDTAERHFGHEVKRAVITVPANFNDRQRQEVDDAAKDVGFEVLQLIDEPTAAAFAFGFDNFLTKDKKVMFFDLGGGTFDVSIFEITRDCIFEVLATAGDTHFGGTDFDQVLLEHFAREIKEKYDKDITNDPRALRRLRTACVSTKEHLSRSIDTHIEVDALIGKEDFNSGITRLKFEKLSANLFEKIPKTIDETLSRAKLEASDIDDVVLIGGSTRIPKVKEILNKYFREKLNYVIIPDEAVAFGAAIQAAVLSGSKFKNSSKKFEIRNSSSSAINEIERSIESSTNLSKAFTTNDYNIREVVEKCERTSFSRSSKSIQNFEKQNETSGYNMINGSEYRDVRDLPNNNDQSGWLAKEENQKSINVCPNVELPAAHKNERNSYIHRPSNTDDEVRGKFEKYLKAIEEILVNDKLNLSEENFEKLEEVWRGAVEWLEKKSIRGLLETQFEMQRNRIKLCTDN